MRFTPGDPPLLAALLHRLPRDVLKRLHLVVRPDTVLRWHRHVADTPARPVVPAPAPGPAAYRALGSRPGVAAGPRESRVGYRRVHGELLVPGVKVAASTVWEILHDAGTGPVPDRSSATWADFLRSRAGALLACDFFETVTLSGARLHVLAVIEHASRRIRILGATIHPAASWAAQAARLLAAAVAARRAFTLSAGRPPGRRLRLPVSGAFGASLAITALTVAAAVLIAIALLT